MKKILILLFILYVNLSYGQTDSLYVKWFETSFDFNKVSQFHPASHEFKFLNISQDTIRITSVEASCGCTRPEWSDGPIPPNSVGYVKATYSSANLGPFNKTITIYTNKSVFPTLLYLKGEVIEDNHHGHTH